MSSFDVILSGLANHWDIWLVSATLVVAAVIDGWKLKVPNWITFPMILLGWAYFSYFGGWAGLGYSVLGTFAGLGMLLPLYAIGGMGAGDVKLLAGVGAWVGTTHTFRAFCCSAVVGGVIALAMVVYRRSWAKHANNFMNIAHEVLTVGNPTVLAARAAERKSSMLLLPYGIPIAIGAISYFAWSGMFV